MALIYCSVLTKKVLECKIYTFFLKHRLTDNSSVPNYLTIHEILLYKMIIETCLAFTLECYYKRQGEDIRHCTDKSILPI